MRFRNLATAAALLCGVIASADAAVVLVFGQNGTTNNFTGTTNGAQTQTTLGVTNQAITITGIENAATPLSAFLTFSATSSGAATMNGVNATQHFGGNFTITSGMGGAGTNYLSGSFADSVFGTGTSLTLSVSNATPGESVSFTSSVITSLFNPLAISLSFSNVAPPVGICGTTLCPFTSSVSGDFSGNARVPEPGTMGLAGLALLAAALTGRRGRKQV
jgi:hypothetical protein